MLVLYKKSFLWGPKPINSTPLTYRNKGITVIGPARIKNKLNPGFDKLKSLKPFFTII